MLYVIGLSRSNFVKIDINWGEYLNSNNVLSFEFLGAKVTYDTSNAKATFYNNKSDAFKILNHLKKHSNKVSIVSEIDYILGEAQDLNISLDKLKVYSLTAHAVE